MPACKYTFSPLTPTALWIVKFSCTLFGLYFVSGFCDLLGKSLSLYFDGDGRIKSQRKPEVYCAWRIHQLIT